MRRLKKFLALVLIPIACLIPTSKAEAQGVSADFLKQELAGLKDRSYFYLSHFSYLNLPDDVSLEQLEAMEKQVDEFPIVTSKKLRMIKKKLDQLVLQALKKAILEVGLEIETKPTDFGNVGFRKKLLLEFSGVLEGLAIPITFYYPKGRSHFVHRLQFDNESVFPVVDEHFKILAERLKGEKISFDNGSSGGGGGLSGPGPEDPSGEPPEKAKPLEDDTSFFSTFRGRSRLVEMTLIQAGIVLLVLGSLVALSLQRTRTAVSNAWKSYNPLGRAKVLMDVDYEKKVQQYFKQGDYRKALSVLNKVSNTAPQNQVRYLKALCHMQLLEPKKGQECLEGVEMEQLTQDEILRLANVAEQSKEYETAIGALEHLKEQGGRHGNVGPRIEQLRELTKDRG